MPARLVHRDRPRAAAQVVLPVRDVLGSGAETATVAVRRATVDSPLRRDILHRVVVWQLACRRAGTSSALGKGQVSGSNRKPHPQKGSGRARAGSIRQPQARGGGRVHGPVPRDHSFTLPASIRRHGLAVALSAKHASGDLLIADSLTADSVKTKAAKERLDNAGLGDDSVLFIAADETHEGLENLRKAVRAIPRVDLLPARGANVYDILHHKKLVVDRAALEALDARLAQA